MAISRIKYRNPDNQAAHFEIVSLERFFATRPKAILENVYRLNFWVLIYVTEGTGTHIIDFKEHTYQPGDMIVLAKNRVQSFRVNYDVRGYIIHINEPFFTESGEMRDMDMLSFFETPPDCPVIPVDMSPNATSRQLIDLIYKEYLLAHNANAQRLIKSLMGAFVYSIRGENHRQMNTFSTAAYRHYYEYRELIEQHFTTYKAVADYECMMGISKKTINAACRECADISAKELITHRVILEAKRLIALGELKNYEISDALGFDEPANFAGFFKRYTGMSMRAFRDSLQT